MKNINDTWQPQNSFNLGRSKQNFQKDSYKHLICFHRIKKLTKLSDRIIRGSEPLQVRNLNLKLFFPSSKSVIYFISFPNQENDFFFTNFDLTA